MFVCLECLSCKYVGFFKINVVLSSESSTFETVFVRWHYLQAPVQEKYTCGVCSAQIIKTKHSIERHMRELHSEGQVHACNKCGRTYDSYHKMQRHLKSHGDTGGICHVCGKVSRNLALHNNISTDNIYLLMSSAESFDKYHIKDVSEHRRLGWG